MTCVCVSVFSWCTGYQLLRQHPVTCVCGCVQLVYTVPSIKAASRDMCLWLCSYDAHGTKAMSRDTVQLVYTVPSMKAASCDMRMCLCSVGGHGTKPVSCEGEKERKCMQYPFWNPLVQLEKGA